LLNVADFAYQSLDGGLTPISESLVVELSRLWIQ